MRCRTCALLMLAAAILGPPGPALAEILFTTDFDSLTPGTVTAPATPGHDDWYLQSSDSTTFAAIQSGVAHGGQALQVYSDPTTPIDVETNASRPLPASNLAATPIMQIAFDFLARSSDYDSINIFEGNVRLSDGSLEMLHVLIAGGNGEPKSATGVHVGLYGFNGTDNNEGITLTVGQSLAWDAWHQVTLIANQATGHYVSITVDGLTQDLSAYALPYSYTGTSWIRGDSLDQISVLTRTGWWLDPDSLTSDELFVDNIQVALSPEPASLLLLTLGSLLLLRRR